MITAASENFTKSYSNWLLERIETVERGRGFELSTPFLDPFNDGLRVFAEPKANGFLLHDDGLTLENLACMGIDTHSSDRRQRILNSALSGCGVAFEGGRIQIEASMANLPQRIHLLLMAMLRVNDLWMTVTPHRTTDFFEMVCEFLDKQEVSYSTNIAIPGKTVEHPIDILISFPRRKERLIKLVSRPDTNNAKLVSFTWMELAQSRPDAEKVILVNDTLAEFAEDGGEQLRSVSDQTVNILSGYSDRVFRWSGRAKPEFKGLWLPS